MNRLFVAAVTVVISVGLIALSVGAFTASEKTTIAAMKARITALEGLTASQQANLMAMAVDIDTLDQNTQALDARLAALEGAQEAFTFSNITASVSPPCTVGNCYVDISWNVEPCATGQVEWGRTEAYGNLTTLETGLLCFHRQRISGLDPDTEYHYRIIATDGAGTVAYHTVS